MSAQLLQVFLTDQLENLQMVWIWSEGAWDFCIVIMIFFSFPLFFFFFDLVVFGVFLKAKEHKFAELAFLSSDFKGSIFLKNRLFFLSKKD